MKIINLEDLKIEPVKGEYVTVSTDIGYIDLDKSLLEINTHIKELFTKTLQQYVDNTTFNVPVLFQFDVKATKDFNTEDIKSTVDIILSCFSSLFSSKEKRDRESRFGLNYLPDFETIKDNQVHVMRMINYKTKVEKFNLMISIDVDECPDIYYYYLVD